MEPFFFFLLSNNDIYSRTLPYAKKHGAERKLQREKKEKKDLIFAILYSRTLSYFFD